MAATLVIVVTGTNETIGQLNADLQLANVSAPQQLVNYAIDHLAKASMGGIAAATVQITSRDTAPSITTSGSGSTQVSVSLG